MMPESLTVARLYELSIGSELPSSMHLDDSLPISPNERLAWERKLNRYLHSCGCAQGTVGLLAGLVIVAFLYFWHPGSWSAWQIAAAVACPIALLALGKTAGRRLDRMRFRRACKSLLSTLSSLETNEGDSHGQVH